MLMGSAFLGCVLGCMTLDPASPPPEPKADNWIDELLKQEAVESKNKWHKLKPDFVLKEVPLQTPLAQARSIMERHGFSCWAGLSDNRGDYLHCTAYKRKNQACADKLTVKFHYDARRVIDCEVILEGDVLLPGHRSWTWSPPPPKPKGN
jgi:hypothetical protein